MSYIAKPEDTDKRLRIAFCSQREALHLFDTVPIDTITDGTIV